MLLSRFPAAISATKKSCVETKGSYPLTISVLKDAYLAESAAYKNYVCCSQKAVAEGYPNIAYLFISFSNSEKIHADNYSSLLKTLCSETREPENGIVTLDTKSNLRNASKNELLKINRTYPEFLAKLENESYHEAVINCMYSWKSHQQH